MKWVTREKAKVDRIACPWLIKKSINPQAEFLFVPAEMVMHATKEQNAVPFDVSERRTWSSWGKSSFDAVIEKYNLKDTVWLELAEIVRGADTNRLELTLESAGLEAIAAGFHQISKDDLENISKQFHVYDALYAYCKRRPIQKNRT